MDVHGNLPKGQLGLKLGPLERLAAFYGYFLIVVIIFTP